MACRSVRARGCALGFALAAAACSTAPGSMQDEPVFTVTPPSFGVSSQHDAGNAGPPRPVAPVGAVDAGPEAARDVGMPEEVMAGMRLSETGLYADTAAGVLAAGVREYTPRFALWSDGAQKRRWLKLPEGAVIDSSDMDFWSFPIGTQAWKEFSRDGVRIETRLIERRGPTEWLTLAFVWSDDQSDAIAMPFGMNDAKGTPHDVPGQSVCEGCHNGLPSRLLGVSAIQLAQPGGQADGALTLDALVAAGALSEPPQASLVLPGDAAAQQALGYLHANCGHCHNSTAGLFDSADMDLWLRAASLDAVEHTPAYQTAVGVAPQQTNSDLGARIAPGAAEQSEVVRRMSLRTFLVQMPPIASEAVDEQGLAAVRAWIDALSPDDTDAGF